MATKEPQIIKSTHSYPVYSASGSGVVPVGSVTVIVYK